MALADIPATRGMRERQDGLRGAASVTSVFVVCIRKMTLPECFISVHEAEASTVQHCLRRTAQHSQFSYHDNYILQVSPAIAIFLKFD
jgi:hypothetical protein